MSSYRSSEESLRAQNAELAELLALREHELAELHVPRAKRRVLTLAAMGLFALACCGFAFHRTEPVAFAAVTAPANDGCDLPGVHFVLEDAEAFVPARGTTDLAGHVPNYLGGERSAWFTVNPNDESGYYVSGQGKHLPTDIGVSSFSLLTIRTKTETSGYQLAPTGLSFLEVSRSDSKFVAGRFEADVSRGPNADSVRVRGEFCLPARTDPTTR